MSNWSKAEIQYNKDVHGHLQFLYMQTMLGKSFMQGMDRTHPKNSILSRGT